MRFLTIVTAALLVACTGESRPPLVADDIVVSRAMPGMTMSAAYLSLQNNSAEAITITRVSSNEYDSVEMHQSSIEDGVARMRKLPELTIPAGSAVALQRGGRHLMLMHPTGPAESVTLDFYSDDTLLLSVVAKVAPESD